MIFDRLFAAAADEGQPPGPLDDYWYLPFQSGASETGLRISPEEAMRCSAVYASVMLLAQTVASLPLFVFRRGEDGISKRRATNHPLYDLLHARPNHWQSSFEFREMMQRNLALHGNAYAVIVAGPRGMVDALVPLHPNRVRVYLLDSGRLRYEHQARDGSTAKYTQDEILHLRGLSSDGYVGASPIEQLPEAVALSLAAEAYGARFFKNNARPTGVIEFASFFKDKEAKQKFIQAFQEAYSGPNMHRTAVLEHGMTYKPIGMTHDDAQLIEIRKLQVEEIARIYNIPLPYLKDDTKSNFANSEQKAIDFVVHTIRPWLVRWEQAYARALILRPDRFFAEHLVEGLQRGDIKSRYEAYGRAITAGWMTRNEARSRENLNPLPGLDEPLHQAALVEESREARADHLVRHEVRRLVDYELAGVKKAVRLVYERDAGAAESQAAEFYAGHAREICKRLLFTETRTEAYCAASVAELREALAVERRKPGTIDALMPRWRDERNARLHRMATRLVYQTGETRHDRGEIEHALS